MASASLRLLTMSNPTSNTPHAPGVTPRYHGQQLAMRLPYPTALRTHGPSSHSRNADTGKGTPNTGPSTCYQSPLCLFPTPPPHLPLARMPAVLSLRLKHLHHPSRPANWAPKAQPTNPINTTTTTSAQHPTLPSDPTRHHGPSNT
jgi:hypothetical protein